MNQHAQAAMPSGDDPFRSKSDDPRMVTLKKLARLRDTIADLQSGGPAPAQEPHREPSQETSQETSGETGRELARIAQAATGVEAAPRSAPRHDNLEGAVSRILARRRMLEDGEVQTRLPEELSAVRRQLGDLAQAFHARGAPGPVDPSATPEHLSRQMKEQVEKIDALLTRRLHQHIDPRHDATERAMGGVHEALRDLAQRFDDETRRVTETVTGVGDVLSREVSREVRGAGAQLAETLGASLGTSLGHDLEAVAARLGDRIAQTVAGVETTMRDQGGALSAQTRSVYEQILGAVGDLTDTVAERITHGADPDGRAVALAEIEHRLGAVAETLATVERNVNDAPVLRRVERELRAIMDPSTGLEARIGSALEARFDALDTRLTEAGWDTTDTDLLTAIEAKIDDLTGRVADGLGDARVLERFEAEMSALRTQILETARDGQQALETRLAQLQDQIERGQIEHRMAAGSAHGPAPAIAEEQVDTLIARIEALVASSAPGGEPATAQIAHQLAELMERFERHAEAQTEFQAERRAAGPSHAHDASGLTRDAVVEAVHEAAGEILRTALSDAAKAGNNPAAVRAVEAGLAELRVLHESGERRTTESLDLVRDTVERVSQHLERIDAGAARTSKPAAPVVAAPSNIVAAPTPAPDAGSSFAVDDRLRAARTGHVDQTHDMPEDFAPIAPGKTTGKIIDKTVGKVSDKASDEPGGRLEGPAPGGAPQSARANFIAAARRAARESAAEEAARADASGSRRDRKAEAKSDAAAGASVVRLGSVRRAMGHPRMRPALLAAAAILLAIGTVKLATDVVVPDEAAREIAAVEAMEAPLADVVERAGRAEAIPSDATAPQVTARASTGDGDVVSFETPIESVPRGVTSPAPDANLARLEALPRVGEPDQFAPTDAAAAGLNATRPGPVAAPTATAGLDAPGPDAPDTSPNAASVQAALSNAPAAAATPAGPEPALLASLPEAIGPEALRVAAASGDPVAQYEIARRLGAGEAVAKDDAAALAWLERAAAQDLAPAQYRLGSFYENGVGTERDVSVARAWYERAAAQGNARAMHNTGVLHAEGAFGEADFERAVGWFEKGARLGVPDSQFNLGIVYGRGLGVPQDLASAYMWFDASAKAGDADAAAKRDEVAAAMDAATLKRAEAMAAELVVSEPAAQANAVVLPAEFGAPEAAQAQLSAAEQAMLIKQVQAVLTHRGYDVGPIDGIPGGRTASAIRDFQTANGLAPNGRIDEALLEALTNGNG